MEIIIKLDHDEKVNTKVEKLHPEDELHPMNEVIQDLKLENDRLKQREEKMLRVIKSIACDYGFCEHCLFYKSDKIPCADAQDDYVACVTLLKELEDL